VTAGFMLAILDVWYGISPQNHHRLRRCFPAHLRRDDRRTLFPQFLYLLTRMIATARIATVCHCRLTENNSEPNMRARNGGESELVAKIIASV
jgi:hypothetical protein